MKTPLQKNHPMVITVVYQSHSFTSAPTVFEFPIEDRLENLRGAKPLLNMGDLMEMADENLLEIIFRECNHVDGTEWIANKKLRSMSVGDMVIVDKWTDDYEPDDPVHWVCMMSGWKRLEDLEITPIIS